MTHGSVFSGIGGPEVAATMLGWENLFHCEINPFGKQVLDYWYPNAESYEDITKTDFTKWRGRVSVLSGGFPCQPFSYAGKRRGADDDRYLWPHMFRCIDEIRPNWVVAENVAGIISMVEQGEVSSLASQAALFDEGDSLPRYQLRQTFTLQRICEDLEGHGYSVQTVLIPACSVGAPHRRDRVFIIGHRDATDTECKRLFPSEQEQRPRFEERLFERGCGRPLREGDALADPDDARFQEARTAQQSARDRGFDVRTSEWVKRFWKGEEIGSRWSSFPTVSPVHRGNDGLPFDVDRLTLPFLKWRTEALKAYGNAIVPQVIYEIFYAIEQIEGG